MKTATQIIAWLHEHNFSCFAWMALKLQAFLDEGEEEPPQSFTAGMADMIECKGVDPEVAHTLPPSEIQPGGGHFGSRPISREEYNLRKENTTLKKRVEKLRKQNKIMWDALGLMIENPNWAESDFVDVARNARAKVAGEGEI